MFPVKKVYYDPFRLSCINSREKIAISSKNGGIGNQVFCSQKNEVHPHLNIYPFLLKYRFAIGIKATKG